MFFQLENKTKQNKLLFKSFMIRMQSLTLVSKTLFYKSRHKAVASASDTSGLGTVFHSLREYHRIATSQSCVNPEQ